MDKDHERALLRRFKEDGDSAALAELFHAHQFWIWRLASRYCQRDIQFEDLHQEAFLALTYAAHKFDLSKDIRFNTYAGYWIRAYLLTYIGENRRIMPFPTSRMMRDLRFRYPKAVRLYGQLDNESMAEVLGVKPHHVEKIRLLLDGMDSEFVDGMDRQRAGYVPPLTPEELAHEKRWADRAEATVSRLWSKLSARERVVIEARYFEEEPVSHQILAQQFGVTRQRVRQIEKTALQKLRLFVYPREKELVTG